MRDRTIPWWEQQGFHALLVALAALPFLYPAIPPLVDLPGHMGQYRIEIDYAKSPELQRFYALRWNVTGNLGVDLLVLALAKLFGLGLAVKLVTTAIPMLTIVGILRIAGEVHRRVPPAALFALPLAFGQPFIFGFVNFSLAMALALNAFALWLQLGRLRRERLRAVLFLAISPLLWLCHIYGWATLCLFVASAECVDQCARMGCRPKAVLAAAIRVLPLAPPLLLMVLWRSRSTKSSGFHYNWLDKLQWCAMILRDRWMVYDIASALFLVVALILVLKLRQNEIEPRLTAAALVLLGCYIALPAVIFGGSYADMRLTPYMLMAAFMAVRPKADASPVTQNVVAATALIFFVLRIAGTTASFAQSAQAYDSDLQALDHVPVGSRIAAFVGHPCRSGWNPDLLDHLASLAIVRKAAFTNDQWDVAGTQVVWPTYLDGSDVDPRYRRDPYQLVTAAQCGATWSLNTALGELPRTRFDFVWLIDPPIFDRANLAGTTEVWHNGSSALYQITGQPKPD